MKTVKFIDLFAGIGGIRKGFEIACEERGWKSECVFTSEIKPHAIKILTQNHPNEKIHGDITQINADDIPDFDFLLAGFPCQAFSMAGKRLGFQDTRGTLFFDVARILEAKKPKGFVLENVEGLTNHDNGKTLKVILNTLDELGYYVTSQVLNAKDFGIPQSRKRIYIVGSNKDYPDFSNFEKKKKKLGDILEHGLECEKSEFIDNLLNHFDVKDLPGKSIKDKRGGKNNIHSWDIEIKGKVSKSQRNLLNKMMTERRKKQWAEEYGIDWMDGMPLTIDMIRTFNSDSDLEAQLEDLVEKRYLVKEYPKKKIKNGTRVQDNTLPLGYNIVAGKMSYQVNKVLDPESYAPTLVAMDMQHLYVVDGEGIRRLSLREGLRLFGYPDNYKFDIDDTEGYDLLGNTVVVPVIAAVSNRLLDIYE